MAKNTPRARIVSFRILLVQLVAAVVISTPAFGGEWDISGDLFTGITYTDNVGLGPSGSTEEEFAWEISPRLIASRDGKQVDIQLDYRLQGLLYAREDGRNEVYNYLQSRMQADVIPDFFHVDADASISQTIIDPLLGAGNSAISTNGNSAETLTVNVSPSISKRFGPSTVFSAGISASLVEYDDAQLIDNKQRSYFGSLRNEADGGLLSWSFGYNSAIVEYDLGQEIELARLSGEVGFRLGPRTEFVVSGGEDFNDFGSLPGNRVAEGTFWNAGFRGGLGNNLDFDVRVGEQFFGDSYSVELTRTSRALVTSLSYTEEATTIGAQQLDFSNALGLIGPFGNLPDNFDVNGFELPPRIAELYIRRRLDFNNTLNTDKSLWRFVLFYEDRTIIRSVAAGARENVQGARIEWRWTIDSATTLNSNINYQKLDSRDGVSEPRDLRFSVQLRRAVFDNSYLQVMALRNSRKASTPSAENEEHVLEIGFGRRF